MMTNIFYFYLFIGQILLGEIIQQISADINKFHNKNKRSLGGAGMYNGNQFGMGGARMGAGGGIYGINNNFNPNDNIKNPDRPELESIYKGKILWGGNNSSFKNQEIYTPVYIPNDDVDKFGNPLPNSEEIRHRPKPKIQPKRKEQEDIDNQKYKRDIHENKVENYHSNAQSYQNNIQQNNHNHEINKRNIEAIYKGPQIQSIYNGPKIESIYKGPVIESRYKGPVIEAIYKGPVIKSEYKGKNIMCQYNYNFQEETTTSTPDMKPKLYKKYENVGEKFHNMNKEYDEMYGYGRMFARRKLNLARKENFS